MLKLEQSAINTRAPINAPSTPPPPPTTSRAAHCTNACNSSGGSRSRASQKLPGAKSRPPGWRRCVRAALPRAAPAAAMSRTVTSGVSNPVTPPVRRLAAELIDLRRQRTIVQRLAPQPGQHMSDRHPWPPVGW